VKPAVHFILGGTALLAADLAWRSAEDVGAPERAPIVVSAARVTQLRDEHARRYGAPPSAAELEGLLATEATDELLYREALALRLDRDDASIRWRILQKMRFIDVSTGRSDDELIREGLELGLDRDDLVVRRILAQKMRLLAQQPARNEPIDESALTAYLDAHREVYRQPPRISLAHVFLSRDRRGESVEADAIELLHELEKSGAGPDAAAPLGDPFPLGRQMHGQSERQLEKLFGHEFAAAVQELPTGRWSGPIPSAYGLHLVLVGERIPGRDPLLREVRTQVEQRLRAERAEGRVADLVQELRGRYQVRIESPLPTEAPPS
jgi:hypothetical protein